MASSTSGRSRRGLPSVGLAALATLAAACGGGDGPTPPSDTPALAYVSGNGQSGTPAGQQLPQPLVVQVTRGGAAASGVAVAFAVQAGGGQLSTPSATTDASGQASVRLTLGPTAGATNTVAASLGGATGSPVTFTETAAAAGAVTLTGTSADTLVEGQQVTLTGSGFSATASANVLTVDGAPATVVSATPTSLTFIVPAACQPAGAATLQVTVSGASGTLGRPRRPASYFSLAPGQQVILRDPSAFCLQLQPSTSAEAFLIGVQSTSETPSSLTPVTLGGAIAAGATGSAPLSGFLARLPALGGTVSPLRTDRRGARWSAHLGAEARLRESERRVLPRLGAPLAMRRAAARGAGLLASIGAITPSSAVGDTVALKVRDVNASNACSATPITAVVRKIGAHAVWVEDVANPANGYQAADFTTLADRFDQLIWPNDDAYFGHAPDNDGNGRAIIVVTKEINRAGGGLLGFVSGTDFFPTTACAGSNEGEYFYMVAPDPAGQFPAFGVYAKAAALGDAPFLIAHEYTHIVQLGRRIDAGLASQDSWLLEGQASLAEEVVGHADESHAPGQNLGLAVALNWDDEASTDWYSNKITDLALYFGFAGSSGGVALPKVAGAPEQCSWITNDQPDAGPCLGGRQIYGLPWMLLRWASDQYGPAHAGGEKGLQQALIDGPATGYAALTAATGVPTDSLLAMWSAALYLDDRGVPGVSPRLTVPSWNLFDIFQGTYNSRSLFATTRLTPAQRGFASFNDALSVRAGSSSYTRVSGASRPATAVRIRDGSGGPLPSYMRVWVVRLQ